MSPLTAVGRGLRGPEPPVPFCVNKKVPKNHLNLRFKNPLYRRLAANEELRCPVNDRFFF